MAGTGDTRIQRIRCSNRDDASFSGYSSGFRELCGRLSRPRLLSRNSIASTPRHPLFTGSSASRVRIGNADSSGRRKNVIDQLDLTSVATARSALDWCRTQVQRLAREQGMLGASQSRLESQLGNLQGSKLESTEAASRITDADFAEEVSGKATAEILQGSSIALLAQANLQPQVALNVLRGELGKNNNDNTRTLFSPKTPWASPNPVESFRGRAFE